MAEIMKFKNKTVWNDPVITVYDPSIVPELPEDQFHNGMSLTWDEVTEIYEDEERRIHFIVFDYTDVTTSEMLQKLLELGFVDFGFKIILKSYHIAIWYFPGGAEQYKEHYYKNLPALSWKLL